ncbi:hypothetical protein ElyMa_005869700 [Elysia marginata]|uniref:Uncharacterized protein n=1 Tax=Elysia marginata TaxID=1093978 RepID=A0AAV4G198_9GAST|nr:hypothetical protein ElyMa_005869700 [Elysia marginata]
MELPGPTTAVVEPKTISPSRARNAVVVDNSPDTDMKDGLFSVSQKPARLCDIKTFQTLHNPRIHSEDDRLVMEQTNGRQRDLKC